MMILAVMKGSNLEKRLTKGKSPEKSRKRGKRERHIAGKSGQYTEKNPRKSFNN